MGKRKRRTRAEPTLFDLPLRPADGGSEAGETGDETGRAGGAPARAPDSEPAPVRPGQGPSILFDEDDGADGEAQLDLIELETGAGGSPEPGAGVSSGAGRARDQPPAARGETAGTGPSAEPPPGARASDEAPSADRARGVPPAARGDRALLGDRLLGGLADLAAQLIALGLAIAATHAMDIVVTVADWMPFAVLMLSFSFLYWVVPLAFWGQTPGMAWVGHTARSSSGEPLAFGQTVVRWLGAVLTLALAGLPLLFAVTGRSLTDRISDSRTTAGD